MYAIVYNNISKCYAVVIYRTAEKLDYLTIIEKVPTYRKGIKRIEEIKEEMFNGNLPFWKPRNEIKGADRIKS